MSEKNKALAKHLLGEVFSRGKVDNLASLFAKDVVIHDTDKELHGLAQVRQGIITLRAAFPDLHYTIGYLLTDNDKVKARCRGAGTHNGIFRGIPATGKKMSYRVIFIWRFADDKLTEHWSVSDVYGMLQQLGVIQIKSNFV
ncbi:MAG: ester cyclase [Flavisolibacter sp.]|nr:ester cyclase [Flavisolibacter sp.]